MPKIVDICCDAQTALVVFAGASASALPCAAEIKVGLFEPMGAGALVRTTLAGQPFHFRLDGQVPVKDRQRMAIGFDPARAVSAQPRTPEERPAP